MNRRGKGRSRRSAAEWAKLIDAWTSSGLSSTEFGEKHGIEGDRLTWWKWHLGRSGKKSRPRRRAVELLKLDVLSDRPSGSHWELRTAAGDILHVNELLTIEELRVILQAFGLRAGRH